MRPLPDQGDASAWPADAQEVARIADAWGVKGWVKVQPFSSDPQALFGAKRWYVQPPEVGTGRPAVVAAARAWPQSLKVLQVRVHGDGIVAQVEGVEDRSTAESLRGARLFVSRSSFPSAAEDEYYWIDLIGLDVCNRQGQRLGRVAGLLDTGPHSVLRVLDGAETEGATERLIPFVAAYVDDVDLAQRRITVDWGFDY